MRVTRFVFSLAVSSLPATTSLSGQATPQAPPQIVANGQAEVRVVPDRATVSIGVETRAATAAAAATENAKNQKAVIDAIRALGIPGDQIATQAFSVQP